MDTKLRYVKLILIMFLISMSCLQVLAQNGTKNIQITKTDIPPKIDGRIDDACWQGIEPVSGFYQYDPVNGAKASEETLVWAAYDKKNLYFAFLMKDSQPEKIWAELTPRNRYRGNDSIEIILDTYNDKRTNIEFTVNALGVQRNSFETIWKSKALMRPDGWAAEIAIPFKSLRFSTDDIQTWGINFQRYITRKNELDFWTNVVRGKPRQQQMGVLIGLEGVKPSYNLELFPYFGGRLSRWNGEKDDKVAVGLDVKYGILPNLILDMTASPDFSEVESDPFIYQLSPYENYMRENRPFFTEGSQYFGGGRDRWWGRQATFPLFYSRRVHTPKFAAKVTGKTDGWSFGLLGSFNKAYEDEEEEDIPANFFSVLRVKKDIFKNSQIGFYYAGIDEKEDYNRNAGFDYSFNFKDFYYIRGQSAFSLNKNISNKGTGMHVAQFERRPDAGLQLELFYKRVEENVDVRTGYVTQTDTQKSEMDIGYAWRFNNKNKVKRVRTGVSGSMGHDCSGSLTEKNIDIYGRVDFLSRLELDMRFETGQAKYQVYDENDNLFWAPDFIDVYGGRLGMHWFRGGFLKSINIWGRWHHRGIYNDEFTAVEPGSESNVDLSITLRPKTYLEFSVGGEWTRQQSDSTGEVVFSGITYNTHLHYQATRNLFFTTRLKGETVDDQYNMDALIGYYFGAGNIIQLSYKKSRRVEDGLGEKGYSITLKVSYLLRI